MSSTTERLSTAYLSCRDLLIRTVSKIVPQRDVEDIVQETFLRVHQSDPSFTIRSPKSYIVRTARNLAIDHIKRAEYRLSEIRDSEEVEHLSSSYYRDEIYSAVASEREYQEFCHFVKKLPKKCQQSFILKKVYGYSQKEIAVKLGVSESTVEKHIANGIRKCTQMRRDVMRSESKNYSE